MISQKNQTLLKGIQGEVDYSPCQQNKGIHYKEVWQES
jgi:hypothetical protein